MHAMDSASFLNRHLEHDDNSLDEGGGRWVQFLKSFNEFVTFMSDPRKPLIIRTPLYQQVAALLREKIRKEYSPGVKLPAETELASYFGVSVLTLREAMNSLAQEGLVARRQGSGTYVQDRLRWRPEVAVLLPQDIGNPLFSYFARRIFQQVRLHLTEAGCLARGYVGFKPAISEYDGGSGCPDFDLDVHRHRFAGVVLISGDLSPEIQAELRRQKTPVVQQATFDVFSPLTLIQMGVQALVQGGRRRLAMTSWSRHARTNEIDWHSLFAQTLKEQGLAYRREWVRDDLPPAWKGAGWSEFREIWFAREKPDGLLITDDVLSESVAHAIAMLNIEVPGQLMVVTQACRGSAISYPFPVTRLMVDPDHYALAKANQMLGMLGLEPLASHPDTETEEPASRSTLWLSLPEDGTSVEEHASPE
ncbi:MAG: GntR family transcriptional regulator [Phycisphaeraceae bacterium]|nr:GntR family transcriptional regulator [Phycisphaeraceae bacterium]